MKWLVLFALATPALADCPASPDIDDAEAAIFSDIAKATTEMEARAFGGKLWMLWLTAPDIKAQWLLDKAIGRREVADYEGADQYLVDLVDYCPDYAEGHNQRGFVAFLRNDFEGALPHIEAALDIRPAHTGALTGMALTLIQLGREDEAEIYLRRALRLNPFLSERHLLPGLQRNKL